MEALASVDDLLAGWPGHPGLDAGGSSTAAASVLLERASALVRSEMGRYGVEEDPEDECQALNLVTVVCGMARRALTATAGAGIASVSQGIGTTSASVQYSNPDGNLYITAAERDLLGLRSANALWSLRPAVHCGDDPYEDGEAG